MLEFVQLTELFELSQCNRFLLCVPTITVSTSFHRFQYQPLVRGKVAGLSTFQHPSKTQNHSKVNFILF